MAGNFGGVNALTNAVIKRRKRQVRLFARILRSAGKNAGSPFPVLGKIPAGTGVVSTRFEGNVVLSVRSPVNSIRFSSSAIVSSALLTAISM